MIIGIDARLYGPKWGGGGLGRYVEELVQHLQQSDTRHRYVVFVKPENADACRITNPAFSKIVVDTHWYTLKEQLVMPEAIKKAGVELMHYPHWNIPVRSPVPFVVTIHDLILLDDPASSKATHLDPIRYAVKRAGYHYVLHKAINKSQEIIAVSQYTKDSILRHFKTTNPDKISVIYEGVSGLNSTLQNPNDKQISTSKFEISKPYFLYVGSAYPHKNLESLLHAFSFFSETHPDVTLVFVGKHDRFYRKLIQEVEEIGIRDRVLFADFVDDTTLSELYTGATLYLYPSRIEGFGLPPLEAMQHGTPVAAAKRASLPEVLGDAAVYFDPDNIEEIVAVMEQAIKNDTGREAIGKKGRSQADRYSWKKMTQQTLEVYEKAAAKK